VNCFGVPIERNEDEMDLFVRGKNDLIPLQSKKKMKSVFGNVTHGEGHFLPALICPLIERGLVSGHVYQLEGINHRDLQLSAFFGKSGKQEKSLI
jgi:hypothetical protein